MSRIGNEVQTTEPASPESGMLRLSWRTGVLSAVFLSVLVIPVGLTYYFLMLGPPETSHQEFAIGIIAMLPGFLMGGSGLLMAALK